jgi:serum/glucocorticoid-regulated kinase 2
LAGIEHPYLVQLRYAFQTSKKLYMIMDYYAGGCLFFHLRRQRRFSFEQACFYAAELMLAMNYLHSLDIIYRDVKLENVLMDKNGHVHLTDFGLSKEGVNDNFSGAETFCGTAEYVAPELLQQKPYGKAADWWSFGILLYEMIVGKTPFFSRNRSQMFHSITNNQVNFPNGFPPDAVDIITKLLHKDPKERIGCSTPEDGSTLEEASLKEFQAHPYFAKIDWDKMMAKTLDPPYKPTVKNDMDTKYVHKVFLQQPVEDEKGNDVINRDEAGYDDGKHFADFEFNQEDEMVPAGEKLKY